MRDTNPTRARARKHREAFEDVIGDPYTLESIEGNYIRFRFRSILSASRANIGEGQTTSNPCKPNTVDFCCDVERVIRDVLPESDGLYQRFLDQYIHLNEPDNSISLDERNYLEQRMGRLFVVRGLSPVHKYFSVVKRRSN